MMRVTSILASVSHSDREVILTAVANLVGLDVFPRVRAQFPGILDESRLNAIAMGTLQMPGTEHIGVRPVKPDGAVCRCFVMHDPSTSEFADRMGPFHESTCPLYSSIPAE